jgi:hypothetical protein
MAIWQTVGTLSADELIEARLQAHWAAQIVGAVGDAFLERKADDSQSNLGWHDELQALLGHRLPGDCCTGLRISDLTLITAGVDDRVLDELPLSGITLQAALAEMTSRLLDRGLSGPALQIRDYEMPEHAVGSGAAFELPRDGLAELARWFANAHPLIGAIVLNDPHASALRCWPHHFDLATLITFDPNMDPEKARSIGIGMSPGDGGYAEPYLYVNPWPYPAVDRLPGLSGAGSWHTQGWIGAVLHAADLAGKSPDIQLALCEQHLVEAGRACRELLGVVGD